MQENYSNGHMTSQTASFIDLTRPYLEEVELAMRQSAGHHHANLDKAIDHLLSGWQAHPSDCRNSHRLDARRRYRPDYGARCCH